MVCPYLPVMASVLSTLQWLLWPILFCILRQHLVDGGWTATYCRRRCTLMAPVMGRFWITHHIEDLINLLGITGESVYLKSAWSPELIYLYKMAKGSQDLLDSICLLSGLNWASEIWLWSNGPSGLLGFFMWSIWWRLHSNHTDADSNNCGSTKVPILKDWYLREGVVMDDHTRGGATCTRIG